MLQRLILATCAIIGLGFVPTVVAQSCTPSGADTPPACSLQGPPGIIFNWGGTSPQGTGPGTYTQSGVLQPGDYQLTCAGLAESGLPSQSTQGCDEIITASLQLNLGGGASVVYSYRQCSWEVYPVVANMNSSGNPGPYSFYTSESTTTPCSTYDPTLCLAVTGLTVGVVGPSSAQTSWSLNGAARGRTIVSSACAGGQYPPFAAASFDLFDQFNISAPTTYNVTFITSVSVGQGNAPLAGSSQLNPFLPNSAPGNDYIFPGGSGFWYDPPAAYGYTFTMIGSSNFTQILNFPVGIDTDGLFVVRTGGQSIGTFSVGQKVDFVALTGAAVSSFQVLGIEPLVDGDDQVAFPIQLAFDSPTATFTMSPINMIPTSPFCFGDGTGGACPCGNSGAPGHGCENSHTTGGAILTASGISSLADDSLVLSSSGELPMALSIPTQGQTMISPLFFGDGLRCVGGSLKRLYVKHAVGGVATAPEAGDISISARSAAAGDTITVGATRYYYTFYRDASPTFCPDPPGNTWNVSSSLAVVWGL